VLFTHEPSGGPAGMMIRLALSGRLRGASGEYHAKSIKKAPRQSELDAHTMALLYAADRMDHVNTEVFPNLKSNRVVVCDRYLLSTLAYQGISVHEEWILSINRFAPIPDVCIYLDLPVEYAKDRMQRTRWTKDLYEEESILRQVRDRYLRLIANPRPEYGPIITIDASLKPDTVFKKIRKAVEPLLGGSCPSATPMSLSLFEEKTQQDAK